MRLGNHVKAILTAVGVVTASVAVTTATADPDITPDFHNDVINSLSTTDAQITHIQLGDVGNGNISFSIPLDGEAVSVEIWEHSARGSSYRVIEQREDGSYVDVEPSPVSTYRGMVAEIPGAIVAASSWDGQVYGMVMLPDGSRHWIEPLSSRMPGVDPTLHAVYAQEDVIPSLGVCAVVDSFIEETEKLREPENQVINGRGNACGGICVAQFGADADFEFYQAFGSSTTNVENVINNIMNSVNVLYESQVQITHEIEGIIVRTAEPDPYSSTSAGTLLDQFRSHWLNNVGGSIPHDTAQLFTGKNLSGSTIGIAYLSGVCNSLRYSVVETTCCSSFSCRTDLSSHELGHNWSSEHHSGGNSTMNASLTCSNNFITPSRDAISSFRDSRNCLSPLPPADPPGQFNLITPANGETDVVQNPLLQWSASEEVSFYRVSLADNPEFTSPKLNEFGTSNTQLSSLPPGFLDEGVTYYWKVTAFNDAGQTSSTPSVSTFTTLVSTPEPCDGDVNNSQSVDLADLSLVLNNFGLSTSEGDANGDGDVDLADLSLVLNNFGNVCD